MNQGILSWQNETGLINYPLSKNIVVSNFIIDANFIQFDNFVPVLESFDVGSDTITLSIQFDLELVSVVINKLGFVDGTVAKIYATNGRYLGKIVFGLGANILWADFINQSFPVAVPFVSTTIQSIPTQAGVYSIDGAINNVEVVLDANMFDTVVGQDVTLNAVGIPDAIAGQVLKTINGVVPTQNNITIENSDLVKLDTSSPSVVTFNLTIADLADSTNILPAS